MTAKAGKIPVSVIVMTRNSAAVIGRCLSSLADSYDEIVVVDSASTDGTQRIAESLGAHVENFVWNGCYPKKKQASAELPFLRNEWVFFVDSDEVLTPALTAEIAALFENGPPAAAGYFVRGLYVINERILRHGAQNNKIALYDRRAMTFPVVDDLGLPGVGEVEGHYQPVLTPAATAAGAKIGKLREGLLHFAHDDPAGWERRHQGYAAWERGMNARNAWPADPVPWRQALKTFFRAAPGRGLLAFLHAYVLKRGFLDGKQGFSHAYGRYRYYRMIARPAMSLTPHPE